jgi:hypothetical protein
MVKDDLIAHVTLIVFELEIVHGPTTLIRGQISEEILIVLRVTLFERDDLRLV